MASDAFGRSYEQQLQRSAAKQDRMFQLVNMVNQQAYRQQAIQRENDMLSYTEGVKRLNDWDQRKVMSDEDVNSVLSSVNAVGSKYGMAPYEAPDVYRSRLSQQFSKATLDVRHPAYNGVMLAGSIAQDIGNDNLNRIMDEQEWKDMLGQWGKKGQDYSGLSGVEKLSAILDGMDGYVTPEESIDRINDLVTKMKANGPDVYNLNRLVNLQVKAGEVEQNMGAIMEAKEYWRDFLSRPSPEAAAQEIRLTENQLTDQIAKATAGSTDRESALHNSYNYRFRLYEMRRKNGLLIPDAEGKVPAFDYNTYGFIDPGRYADTETLSFYEDQAIQYVDKRIPRDQFIDWMNDKRIPSSTQQQLLGVWDEQKKKQELEDQVTRAQLNGANGQGFQDKLGLGRDAATVASWENLKGHAQYEWMVALMGTTNIYMSPERVQDLWQDGLKSGAIKAERVAPGATTFLDMGSGGYVYKVADNAAGKDWLSKVNDLETRNKEVLTQRMGGGASVQGSYPPGTLPPMSGQPAGTSTTPSGGGSSVQWASKVTFKDGTSFGARQCGAGVHYFSKLSGRPFTQPIDTLPTVIPSNTTPIRPGDIVKVSSTVGDQHYVQVYDDKRHVREIQTNENGQVAYREDRTVDELLKGRKLLGVYRPLMPSKGIKAVPAEANSGIVKLMQTEWDKKNPATDLDMISAVGSILVNRYGYDQRSALVLANNYVAKYYRKPASGKAH